MDGSLIGRGARPVSHDRTRPVSHDRTRPVSHDRTRPVDKVTLWNFSGQRPDAGTVASSRGVKRVRSHFT
jgi:hypothetical protein